MRLQRVALFIGLVLMIVALTPAYAQTPTPSAPTGWIVVNGVRKMPNDEYNGDIYLYELTPDGVIEQRLTDEVGHDSAPSWSPDGTQILFHSDRAGNADIYVMDADGSHVQQLTDSPLSESGPTWSPDGTQIVYVVEQDGNRDLYTMNADGTNPQRLTDNPTDDWQADWSPDGSTILFVSNRDRFELGSLYQMKVDGSGEEQIAPATSSDAQFYEVAWSPDGKTILASYGQYPDYSLYRMNPDGSDFELFLDHPDDAYNSPEFSPDGQYVVFVHAPSLNTHLIIADADGSNLRQMTDADQPATIYSHPSWKAAE